MDVTSALVRIKRQFGDEYDVVINNDDIYGWIHDAELDIIRTTGCNDLVTTAAVGTFPHALPDNVHVKRVSLGTLALRYTSREELDGMGADISMSGEPTNWYKYDGSVWIYPVGTVSDVRSVQIFYNKVPANMAGLPSANAFVVPEVYHEDVITFCIAKAHNKNNNFNAEQAQMAIYTGNANIRRDEYQSADTTIYKTFDPVDFE